MQPELPTYLPDFGAAGLNLPLRLSASPELVVLAFALTVVFWGVMAAIFIYHWRRFPFDRKRLVFGERLFFSVSAVVILVALGGVLTL